jgi:hypothetical protein
VRLINMPSASACRGRTHRSRCAVRELPIAPQKPRCVHFPAANPRPALPQWDAHRAELEQARHLLQMAQRSAARLRADAAAQRACHGELDQSVAALETSCLRVEDAVEQVAAGREWTRGQLETWAAEEGARVAEGRALEAERRQGERGVKGLMTRVGGSCLHFAVACTWSSSRATSNLTGRGAPRPIAAGGRL